MSKAWPTVRLGEVLALDLDRVSIDPSQSYPMVGVLSFGKGLFDREAIESGKTSYRMFYRLKPDHIVMSQLFGWEGALALSSDKFAGKFLSPQFPTFQCTPNKLQREFLGWLMRRPAFWSDLGSRATGMGDRRRTLNPNALFACKIPLPSLAEQQRVVARIEELAGKIHEARRLRTQATGAVRALVRSALHHLKNRVVPTGTLGEVLAGKPRNGWSARCDNAQGGVAVLSLGSVTGFHYRSTEFKRTSLHASTDGHFWLDPGDLLITRSNTPELVGHAAIYSGEPSPCIYPDLMMRLAVRREVAETRFVWYWLQSPTVREFIARNAKGTSPTMKKVSQEIVAAIPYPTSLTLPEQRRIVAELDGLQAQVDASNHLQSETAAELDALLPAILDRAFKGQLV